VDLNNIFFGILIVGSLAIFFLIGPIRASAKQRNRSDRIDWNKKRSPFFKIFLLMLVSIVVIALLIKLFF
jgi:hypothetical protein